MHKHSPDLDGSSSSQWDPFEDHRLIPSEMNKTGELSKFSVDNFVSKPRIACRCITKADLVKGSNCAYTSAMTSNSQPPQSIDELMQRAYSMAGQSLSELAQSWAIQVPNNLKRDKGWVGQLIELQLGATAGSKAEPDFAHLGVELKTLPLSHSNTPLETTYVTVVPLVGHRSMRFEDSVVYHKLKRVLWVPVQGERDIPVGDRIIGTPILWEPTPEQWRILRNDWEELMEMVALGQVESISARFGDALHIRPKAANSRALTEGVGQGGTIIQTLPRGFYLQKSFTQGILHSVFG